MSSSSRQPLSSRPAFLPDEIARREFATVFRGYDPAEVKIFLNQIAEQQGESSDRLADLQRTLVDTEQRVKNPELDEETVTKLLGEQTAQILRSAREAANDMRLKAEEDVSRQLREVHEVTSRMRQEAEEMLAQATGEAERAAEAIRIKTENDVEQMRKGVTEEVSRIRSETESEMMALRQRTNADLTSERSKIRQEAREVIETARAEAAGLVERTKTRQSELLENIVRKRKIALTQVEELRAGRQRLLSAYKMVRTTLDDVTTELGRVEDDARQIAEQAGVRVAEANNLDVAELGEEIVLDRFELDDDVSDNVVNLIETMGEQNTRAAIINLSESEIEEDDDDDDIAELLPMSGGPASGSEGAQGRTDTLQREELIIDIEEDEVEERVVPQSRSNGLIIGESYVGADGAFMDSGLKLRRDAAVGKFRSQAVRRLRKSLQDEQDALVSNIRSGKAESIQALLGSNEDQSSTYQRSVVKLFREVLRTGASSVEGSRGVEGGAIDRAGSVAARNLADELVRDLRSQLTPVIDNLLSMKSLPEIGQLQSRIAEPYHAVRGQYLEELVDDRLGGVFDQGVAFARQQ